MEVKILHMHMEEDFIGYNGKKWLTFLPYHGQLLQILLHVSQTQFYFKIWH